VLVSVRPGVEPARVRDALVARGLWVEALIDATGRTHFLVERHSAAVDPAQAKDPHPLCAKQGASVAPVTVAGVGFGRGAAPVWMSGPCSVESEIQVHGLAAQLAPLGVKFLRGGAYKPRTGPYGFQGLGEEGLALLAAAREATGLRIITEVLDPRHVEQVGGTTDVFQIGARNMQNFQLLREVGRFGKPAMLKRGLSATYDEWLQAAEYLLSEGNPHVMMCERGIRTFEPHTRNTLDLAAVPVLHELTHLPIVVDPSHGVGHARYIPSMAMAAVAAGAHALMIEVHPDPRRAVTDGPQALDLDQFASLMAELARLSAFLGRPLAPIGKGTS
jgi:3-deoxy-7-phosphoheptulonate synthase